MSGAQIRTGRLFNHDSGRSFVAAIDHGLTLGVPSGAEDLLGTVERIVAGRPDAVLVSPGTLDKGGHLFAFRGAPAIMLRTDFIVAEPFFKRYGEGYRVLVSPSDAVAMGADAVIMFLMAGASDGQMFGDNVEAVARAAQEAHAVGLPLIVEVVLWGERDENKRDPELLSFGCRVAAELGADVVKTEYTGDRASMSRLIQGCPVPVLVLGGPKTSDPAGLLDATRVALDAGAKGVIYGRNVWQADDPAAVSRQLRDIIHGGVTVR